MFTNLVEHFDKRAESASYELSFVEEVTVHHRRPRSRRVEKTIVIAWILIALKCWLITWLVAEFRIPVSAYWVNVPTVLFALAATAIYLARD
jgi:hypothetical protein